MIILGVGTCVCVMVVVGIAMGRRGGGDSANFLVAGRSLAVPLVGATLMAQAVDSNATLGNTDLTARFGFWAGFSLPLGLALCLLVTGLFIAGPMNGMGLLTLPDFYRRRYGRAVELLASVLVIFAFGILLAGNLVAGGLLLDHFVGTGYRVGVVAIVVLVVVATVAGGMFSTAYVALVQMAVTLVAAVALLGWVAATYGVSSPTGRGPLDTGQLTGAAATTNWATLIALGVGDIVAIDFMQRIFSARSPETARRACFVGAAGAVLVGLPFSLVALTAVSVVGDQANGAAGGPVLFALLDGPAPVGLAILVIAGIVAALFSTASGAILATAAVAARNCVGIGQSAPGERDRLLWATRLAFLPIVALGVLFALQVPQTGILLTLAFDVLLAALVVPFLLGLFWRGATTAAALAAIVVGTFVRLGLLVITPTIYGVPNTLLYVRNDLVGASFDGWPTFIAAAASLLAFVLTAAVTSRRVVPVVHPEG